MNAGAVLEYRCPHGHVIARRETASAAWKLSECWYCLLTPASDTALFREVRASDSEPQP